MASFGNYLLRNKILSPAQLDEATHSLVVFGGRLGTHLVELGYLPAAEVEKHLARHLSVQVAPEDWVAQPDPAAIAALPLALVKKYAVVPLRIEREKRTLHVAMLDPRDPRGVDELGFAAGLRIQPYILAESRLVRLLERHYRIPRDPRFAWLSQQARPAEPSPLGNDAAAAARRPAAAKATASPEQSAHDRESLGLRALAAHEELVDDDTFAALYHSPGETPAAGAPPQPVQASSAAAPATPSAASTSAPAAGTASAAAAPPLQSPTPSTAAVPQGDDNEGDTVSLRAPLVPDGRSWTPSDVATLEAGLANAGDRDEVTRVALGIARHFVAHAAFFVVGDGVIQGIRVAGHDTDEEIFGVLVPRDGDSMFKLPVTRGQRFRGVPAKSGLDEHLLRALRRGEVREAVVFPVKIRERIVNLLYADNGTSPLGETSYSALATLCDLVSQAYERLILARKRRHY